MKLFVILLVFERISSLIAWYYAFKSRNGMFI